MGWVSGLTSWFAVELDLRSAIGMCSRLQMWTTLNRTSD